MNDAVTDNDLHAYIDGELDPDSLPGIQAALAATPALAKRAAEFRADKLQLAATFGPLSELPLPDSLMRRIESVAREHNASQRRGWMRPAGLMAAAAALLAVALFAAPALMRSPTDALVAEALSVRDGAARPIEEYGEAARSSTADRQRLIAATLGVAVRSPDLSRAGFELAGMRVYNSGRGRALALTYRDARGRDFTVYLHKATGRDAFELRERGATRICIWQNEDLSAVMVADMSSSEMLRVASLTYTALNF